MKKSIFGRAVALLMAGALGFGVLGCDTGNDEWNEETPSTWNVQDKDFTSGAVTAIWGKYDATKSTPDTKTIAVENTDEGSVIKPASGTGATLTIVTCDNKDGTLRFNAAGSLADMSKAKCVLTLELEEQANIVITSYGIGSSCFTVIKNEADEVLVSKDIAKGKAGNFAIIGAPAGKYTIYGGGVEVLYIDTSLKTADIAEQKGVVSIEWSGEYLPAGKTDTGDAVPLSGDANSGYSHTLEVYDSFTPLVNGYTAKTDENGDIIYKADGSPELNNDAENVTANVAWEILDEKVVQIASSTDDGKLLAVGKGETTVRARIGRYVLDIPVTVTGTAEFKITGATDDKTTFEAFTGSLALKAERTDEGATVKDISKKVTWASSDATVAKVSDGTVTGLKAGTATITASLTDVLGNTYEESVEVTITACEKTIVTLLDEENEAFPAKDTVIAMGQKSGRDALNKTTSIVNADITGLTTANIVIGEPTFHTSFKFDTILSNKGESSYKGIQYTQDGTKSTAANGDTFWSFDITITPPTGKSVKLTSLAGDLQWNKKNALISIKNGDTELAKQASAAKKLGLTALELSDGGLVITKETTITVQAVLAAEHKTSGDKIAFGNITLYFAAAE